MEYASVNSMGAATIMRSIMRGSLSDPRVLINLNRNRAKEGLSKIVPPSDSKLAKRARSLAAALTQLQRADAMPAKR